MNTFSKILLLLLSLFIANYTNAQIDDYRTDVLELHSLYFPGVLYKTDSIVYSYDNGGKLETGTMTYNRALGATEWNEAYQNIKMYDGDDNLLTDEFKIYSGGVYIPFSLTEYKYDDFGNNDTIYTMSHSGSDWMKSGRSVLSYNPDNTLDQRREDNWNPVNMDYDYFSLVINTTYQNGMVSLANGYTYNGMIPEDDFRVSYTYTGFGEIETALTEDYDGGWVNDAFQDYSYNDDDLQEEVIVQDWDTSLDPDNWVNQTRTLTTYDFDNGIFEALYQLWDPDESNGGANPYWYDSNKFVAYVTNTLNISDNVLQEGKVFPNPFFTRFSISLQSPLNNEGLLVISDIQGKKISSTKLKSGTKKITIENPNLANGLYFIKVTSNVYSETFKVLKK